MSAMYIKGLLVKQADLNSVSGEPYRQFKRDLLRVFKNSDYLEGYCLGYGFGKIQIKSLKEIEEMSENGTINNYHLFFVKLEEL